MTPYLEFSKQRNKLAELGGLSQRVPEPYLSDQLCTRQLLGRFLCFFDLMTWKGSQFRSSSASGHDNLPRSCDSGQRLAMPYWETPTDVSTNPNCSERMEWIRIGLAFNSACSQHRKILAAGFVICFALLLLHDTSNQRSTKNCNKHVYQYNTQQHIQQDSKLGKTTL